MLLKLPQSMLVLWARVHWPRGRRRRRYFKAKREQRRESKVQRRELVD